MAGAESVPTRRAALLLHGLPTEARDRVLARLTAADSARLQPLLRELCDLGVSPALCRDLQEQAPAVPATPGSTAASARQRVTALPPADVARALKLCSPATMAALLGLAEWPWKDEVLERAGELRRAELQRYLRGDAPALSPAVAEALCERLCRVANIPGGAPWTR
jgi:hypothetical protein